VAVGTALKLKATQRCASCSELF